MTVTINCDMGESYGLWKMGDDAAIMPFITVANVACGFHASDPVHMRNTVRLAKQHGVRVGAHPSLPDLQGFGRRVMAIPRDEMAAIIMYQVGALKAFLDAEGMPLNHIKPHGALYGMAGRDPEIAHAVCDAAEHFGVPVFGMHGTLHSTVYPERGLSMVGEFYSDLEYNDQGMVIITREHHAWEPEAAAKRVVRAWKDGKVTAASGKELDVSFQSVCVHSDTPNAPAVAAAVKTALQPWLA